MPGRALADRDEQRHQPAGKQRTAQPVDVAGRAERRLGDEHDRGDRRDRRHGERDPEEPVEGEVLQDRTGQHDPEPAADSEDARDERDRAGDPLAWKLVTNDPEREREDCAAETLDRARDDHQRQRGDDRREQRARGEAGERDDEHALLAEHVPEPPGDRRHDGRCEEVRGEDPRHARGRGVQIALQHRQSRHDERLKQCVRGAAERQHGEDQAGL